MTPKYIQTSRVRLDQADGDMSAVDWYFQIAPQRTPVYLPANPMREDSGFWYPGHPACHILWVSSNLLAAPLSADLLFHVALNSNIHGACT